MFTVGQRILIKQSLTHDLNFWLRKARDMRLPLVITLVDMTAENYQIRAELRFEDGDNVVTRFKADEIEVMADV